MSLPVCKRDFTLPGQRAVSQAFEASALAVIGVPVYAGRVPNVLLDYLNSLEGNSARAVPIVVFGNRSYDDALLELGNILKERGFNVVAAAAFAARHCFSDTLAAGRPDENDMHIADGFAASVADKLSSRDESAPVRISGSFPYRGYYQVGDAEERARFLRIRPRVLESCTGCMLCASACPMGSISAADPREYIGKCIKCCACVRACPQGARVLDDPLFLAHRLELEQSCAARREPELFI